MPNSYSDTPKANQIVSTTQGPIEANFLYLSNTLGTGASVFPGTTTKDHQISIGGSDGTSGEGRHLQVTFINRNGSIPTVAGIGDGTDSLIYSNNGNLFFGSITGAGAFQLTTYNGGGTFGNTTTGWTFLPGGLILNYGKVTGKSGAWPGGTQTTSYGAPNISFPTAGFAVMTTFIGPSSSSTGDIAIIATNTGNFTWAFTGSSSSSFDGFFWWSIGN